MHLIIWDYFCLHRKFLISNLISRNLKVKYRKSWLGMFWTILIPAGSALIYYVVFQQILNVKIDNYLLFIISGLIPWTFFASTVVSGMEVIVGNYSLLNKVPLPPQSLVVAESLTHYLNLVLSLPVLILVYFASGLPVDLSVLQYPILLLCLYVIAFPIALILGISFVYFRDLRHLVQLVVQFWFYLTPVMYSVKMIPEKYLIALFLNPVGLLFAGFHMSVVDHTFLDLNQIGTILFWILILNFIAIMMLRKLRYKIIEIL